MTAYYNPHTGKMETPEEMGERPADSETVLPVGDSWKHEGAPSGYILALRAYAKAQGIRDFDQYLPVNMRDVDDQGEAQIVEPLALPGTTPPTAPDSPPPQSLPPGP